MSPTNKTDLSGDLFLIRSLKIR